MVGLTKGDLFWIALLFIAAVIVLFGPWPCGDCRPEDSAARSFLAR